MHGIVCIVPPGVTDVTPRGYRLSDHVHFQRPDDAPDDAVVGTHRDASLRWSNGRPRRYGKSLGSMIAGFKSAATMGINRMRRMPGAPVWQSRFNDRILRNEREWRIRRGYIARNPQRWWDDKGTAIP